ncbi:hypothetical protein K440DRAFT_213026 [Wilcoxina mikolae CBS 423.85]|nr:hypothetical protein K440DRAFT_213026 [Wilcoxina mikolae CBS 423.85]
MLYSGAQAKSMPGAREAIPSVRQVLGNFINDDNEIFQNVVRMGGSFEIGGVTHDNFDGIVKLLRDIEKRSALYKTIKFNFYSASGLIILEIPGAGHEGPTSVATQIQQQLEAQNFTINKDGTTVATLKQSRAPTITLNYLNQKIIQTPGCSITNKGFEDCPWLVVEIANTQTYDEALNKMYPYLLGSGGNIAFGIIIDLIKEKRKPKSSASVQATQTTGAVLGVNTPRTLQDGLTVTVKSDTGVASSAAPSKFQHPGSKLAIYHKATISIFKRGTTLEEGASSPTSIVDLIHDCVEIFPAMPTLEWIVKWSDLPFAVQLSDEEKDFEYRIGFTELHSVIEELVTSAKIAEGRISHDSPEAIALRAGATRLAPEECGMNLRVALPPGKLKRKFELAASKELAKVNADDGSRSGQKRRVGPG